MPTTCVTSSITLQPNQPFVLPPGSTIIGTTDTASITSTCVDLTTLETFDCYVARFAGFSQGSGNGDTEYWEPGEQRIYGYKLNNIYTPFSVPLENNGTQGSFDMSDLANKLTALIPSIIATSISYKGHSTNGSNRMSCIVIKTLPSIANSLKIVYGTDAPLDTAGTTVDVDVNFVLLQSLIDVGFEGLPARF
jgi:hypothetical protein